jgi:hypothetical protein
MCFQVKIVSIEEGSFTTIKIQNPAKWGHPLPLVIGHNGKDIDIIEVK